MKNTDAESYEMYRKFLSCTDLKEEVANDLCRLSSKVSFENGCTFIPEESHAAIFFVNHGFLVEEDVLSDGTVAHNYLYGQGSIIFNLATFLNLQQSFQATYRSFCDVELLILNFSSFDKLMKKHPSFVEYSFKGYSEQMAMERNGAVLRDIVDKKSRLIGSLLNLSYFCPNKHLPMSVEQFSLMVNTTRQYCNTVINELSSKGYVTKERGGISVLDQKGILELLPVHVVEIMTSIPESKVLNMDGCFYGQLARSKSRNSK